MNICRHCYVSGIVQGVFYRATAKEKALSMGLTGWVKNLPDGRVELIVCGIDNVVESFCEWLWDGPNGANVTDIQQMNIPWEDIKDFSVRH